MKNTIKFQRSNELFSYNSIDSFSKEVAFLPSVAFVPLQQHTGISANEIFSPGTTVREGQLIARSADKNSSCHIHSPIPGVIDRYSTITLPNGKLGKAAVIKLSGSFDLLGRREENYLWQNISATEILRVLDDMGIINTFEHSFPLVPEIRNRKLSDSRILAVRLYDMDPTCQLDSLLFKYEQHSVLEGCAIIAKAMDVQSVYLVYNSNKWEGPDLEKLQKLFKDRQVLLQKGHEKYPNGNSAQIKKIVQKNSKTDDINPLCIDVVTALSTWEAVVKNVPPLTRYVAFLGTAINKQLVFKCRIGTTIGDLIEECGGFKSPPSCIVINGLITGTAVYDLDTPITKYTKSVHVMDKDSNPNFDSYDCVHCGYCLSSCPEHLDPIKIVTHIRKESFSKDIVSDIQACQFCACCSMVCPSRIALHHIIHEASESIKRELK